MAVEAIWIHGSAVVAQTPADQLVDVGGHPYTNVVGFRGLNGNTFRGHPGGNPRLAFIAAIPTPAFRGPALDSGRHCRLLRVGLKFKTDEDVAVMSLGLADGLGGNSPTTRIPSITVGPAGEGVGGRNDGWIAGRNYFDVPGHPTIYDALVVAIWVRFIHEGAITFHAVGADFDVND